MRDDVIGTFGDAAVTGKPVGDDLREGKPTPLLARAVELADAAQRRGARRASAATGLSDDEVAAIQQVIVDTGALDALERHIAELADEAVAALDRADITAEAKAELVALAAFVAARLV